MAGLLDFIFTNTNITQLSRQEVLAHLRYLDEIITPAMPLPQQVKYYGYKIKLNRQLLEMDKASFYALVHRSLKLSHRR